MFKQNKVLVTGTDRMKIFDLVALFESQHKYQLQTKVIPTGEHDLLGTLPEQPSIIVLILDSNWKDMLEKFSTVPRSQRPELIVIADEFYSDVMQLAMRIGARDYISLEQVGDYLLPTLEQLAGEVSSEYAKHSGKLISVINSKGSSGGSFIAANIAHMIAVSRKKKVALVDFDLMFAPIADYFDLKVENNLSEAIQMDQEDLDMMALNGYMPVHKSGVHILANIPGNTAVNWAIPTSNLNHLIELALKNFDYVIVDVPNQIDPQVQALLDFSDRILLIVQQTLMHLRDGKLLKQLIERECSLGKDNIIPIVNRYNKKSSISLSHIDKALGIESLLTIPNDYSLATQSIESGSLVYDLNPRAKISSSLMRIVEELDGVLKNNSKGFFKSLFSRVSDS